MERRIETTIVEQVRIADLNLEIAMSEGGGPRAVRVISDAGTSLTFDGDTLERIATFVERRRRHRGDWRRVCEWHGLHVDYECRACQDEERATKPEPAAEQQAVPEPVPTSEDVF